MRIFEYSVYSAFDQGKRVVGVVVSRVSVDQVWRIMEELKSEVVLSPLVVDVVAMKDVPAGEVLCFYDREVMARFIGEVYSLGYAAALMRTEAEIDPEVIRASLVGAVDRTQ